MVNTIIHHTRKLHFEREITQKYDFDLQDMSGIRLEMQTTVLLISRNLY